MTDTYTELGGGGSATTTAIQGNPVAPGTPKPNSILQWNGTQYITVGAPATTIVGDGLGWGSSADNAPAIQAWIAANPNGGTLRLINPTLRTAVDWSPLANTSSRIEISGTCNYATNVAEFDLPPSVCLDGSGGGGGGGVIVAPSATLINHNSVGASGQEPNNYSTTASIDGYYHYMYPIQLGGLYAGDLPASQIGAAFNITAAGDPTFITNGTQVSWKVIAVFDSFGTPYARLVFTGTNPPPSGRVNNVIWNCGIYSNNTGAANIPSVAIPCLYVTGHKNLDQNNSLKHWMSLNNCTNAIGNAKLFKIVAAPTPTTCYLNASAAQAAGMTLPDYGVGGSIGSPKVHTYEGAPVVRMTYNSIAKNINIPAGNPGPGFVIDGNLRSSQNCTLEDCTAGTGNSCPASTPCIVDGNFYFYIKKCTFYTGPGTANFPASILLTVTDNAFQQYCGLGQMENLLLNGGGIFCQPEAVGVVSNITCRQVIDEAGQVYNGASWFAVVTIDNSVYAVNNIRLIDSGYADNTIGPSYIFEQLYPQVSTSASVGSLSCDTPLGVTSIFGPNLAASHADLRVENSDGGLNLGSPRNYQAYIGGLTDASLVGAGDDFSPVMTLPFQVPLPPLATVANWQNLYAPTPPTITAVNADGYALWGPDLTQGSMIRISGSGQQNCAIQWSTNVAVGDVFYIFMRAQSQISTTSGGCTFYCSNSITFNNYSSSVTIIGNSVGNGNGGGFHSEWGETVAMAEVTAAPLSTVTMNLAFGGTSAGVTAFSYVFDPESIVVLHVPVSTPPVEVIPQLELIRLYRKLRRQVAGATPGDVAIPGRTGLSFGSRARVAGVASTPGHLATIDVPALSVGKIQVVQAQQLAINDDPGGSATDGYVQQILTVMRQHGLIANTYFNPTSVTGCRYWWNADNAVYNASTGAVTSWLDIVGNTPLTLTQTGGAGYTEPTIVWAQNQKLAAHFNGTTSRLYAAATLAQPCHMWMVWQPLATTGEWFNSYNGGTSVPDTTFRSTSANTVDMNCNGEAGGYDITGTGTSGTWYISQLIMNGASSQLVMNSTASSVAQAGPFGIVGQFYLGGYTTLGTMNVAAIGFYDHVLSAPDQATVLAGLKAKYNL